MDLAISLSGHDRDDELAQLQDWLRQEPELRGRVTSAVGEPRPGELGSVTDVLLVAVGSGGALTALAASLKAYFAQPRGSDIRVTIRTAKGRRVEVDARRVDDLDAVLAALFHQGE